MRQAILILGLVICVSSVTQADDKFDFSFKNEKLVDVVEEYSEQTKEDFVIDPAVKGRVSIINHAEVDKEKAFNQLAAALAQNGYSIVESKEGWRITAARKAHESGLKVYTELPEIQPERMATYVFKLKNKKAEDINRRLRMLISKDGRMLVSGLRTVVFTDFTSNLKHIHDVIKTIDTKD